jgi:hypothetical protein
MYARTETEEMLIREAVRMAVRRGGYWAGMALAIGWLAASPAGAQTTSTGPRTRNVVLIMSDGVRWQEVFRGADPSLIDRTDGGVSDTAGLRREFAKGSREESRATLLPFIWSIVARQGQLYGDRDAGGSAQVTNGLKFSYPGYNETLTGHPDPRIDSNDAVPNPNRTVFEWLNRQPEFAGKVAAFGTWVRFAEIFNRERSGFPIRAGWEIPFPNPSTPARAQLDELYRTTTRLWGSVSYDSFMQQAVLDYVREEHPRVLFVGYGETDEWAHSRRYDQYLTSARRVDSFIAELWNTMQAMPEYRGTTTFIIATDHGRGSGREWTSHGEKVDGAENIWLAVLGPDTPARGVVGKGRVTQSQIAATVAAFLGKDYRAATPQAAPPIAEALSRP